MTETTKSVAELSVLGLVEADEQLYRLVLSLPGAAVTDLAHAVGVAPRTLRLRLDRLASKQLIRLVEGTVVAEAPETSLGRLVQIEADRLRDLQGRLARVQTAIPQLLAEHRSAFQGGSGPIPMETMADADIPAAIRSLTTNTTGEILSMRPDQWALPQAQLVDPVLIEELRTGRQARVLYPAAMLEHAPESIQQRQRAGERVRLLPTVPSRLIVFGTEAALLTAVWGEATGHRLVVRHEGVVGALRALFDLLWQRAAATPSVSDEVGDARRALLGMLAMGAIDEQIARMMGLSLRTVRRRIAELMDDLGVSSRFQAGAEAVRRDWL